MNFNNAKYTASYGTAAQLPESLHPEIVFAGRSNVGKSSLLNKLLGRKALAKVSSKPGKTATINFFEVTAKQNAEEGDKNTQGARRPMQGSTSDERADIQIIDFVDLPGYGYAKVSQSELDRWADLIEGYFNSDRDITLVVSLIDIRHDPSELDRNMVSFLQEAGLPFAIVLTKADKLSNQKAMAQRKRIIKSLDIDVAENPVIATSTESGRGIDELHELISRLA